MKETSLSDKMGLARCEIEKATILMDEMMLRYYWSNARLGDILDASKNEFVWVYDYPRIMTKISLVSDALHNTQSILNLNGKASDFLHDFYTK